MREATLDRAGDLNGVRPAKAAGPSRKTRAPRKPVPGAGRSRAGLRGRALATAASAVFAALMCGIVLNATVFQKGHHPAPLFGSAAEPARLPAAVRAAPQPPPVVQAAAPAQPEVVPGPLALHPAQAASVAAKPAGPAPAVRSPQAAKTPSVARPDHGRSEGSSTAARTRPGQPSAARTASTAQADRNRLAAMMGAAAGR